MQEKKRQKKPSLTSRISIYVYKRQLNDIEEICRSALTSKRTFFLEAISSQIEKFKRGEI
jgi:hypothetical protein